ncbi:MAG TPA: hypothetical protein VFK13_09175 [Gemmatimonadaceae bacterium]|nr:hypothetical protein [Gemmatimonadaceae bacterium]
MSAPSAAGPANTASESASNAPAGERVASDQERPMARAVERGKEKLGRAGERAHEMKNSLADKLDAGARKLRHRADSMTESVADGAAAGVAPGAPSQMDKATDAVARGMEKTATWMRTNDLQSMQSSVEGAVKRHPGKALLAALGLGYVVGRALRGGGGGGGGGDEEHGAS